MQIKRFQPYGWNDWENHRGNFRNAMMLSGHKPIYLCVNLYLQFTLLELLDTFQYRLNFLRKAVVDA